MTPYKDQMIAEWLRSFRLDASAAGSRMPWAREWPLDRLMIAAADELGVLRQRIASLEAVINRERA